MPLGPIFEARISLEAIGSIAYICEKRRGCTVIYYMNYLHRLMQRRFSMILYCRHFFLVKLVNKLTKFKSAICVLVDRRLKSFNEVSRTFLDVYKPVTNGINGEIEENMKLLVGKESEGVPFVKCDFDFNLLQSGLSEQMVPQSALSSVSKEIDCEISISLFIDAA